MKNALGIKSVKLTSLKVGRSALYGPFSHPKAVSAMISKTKKALLTPREYTQKQVILVDATAGVAHKFYIVTRVS